MFATDSKEYMLLKKLNTPEKIQTFLDQFPLNHEVDGVTCFSPARVLREQRAHCIEGAFLAGVCLMIQGEKPLIVSLKARKGDDDHIVTLFQKNGYYGALSKTNHLTLRYRDPVYRTVRELVMSYFHEYFLTKTGKKMLVGYTDPINLRKYGTKWVTAEEDLWDMGNDIYRAPFHSVIPKGNEQFIRPAPHFERSGNHIVEWPLG